MHDREFVGEQREHGGAAGVDRDGRQRVAAGAPLVHDRDGYAQPHRMPHEAESGEHRQ